MKEERGKRKEERGKRKESMHELLESTTTRINVEQLKRKLTTELPRCPISGWWSATQLCTLTLWVHAVRQDNANRRSL
ncbi:hypothetical protein F6X34_03425 [Dickeya dianthicola]|nr:hypothetical protein [Dickeya dianthicola]